MRGYNPKEPSMSANRGDKLSANWIRKSDAPHPESASKWICQKYDGYHMNVKSALLNYV